MPDLITNPFATPAPTAPSNPFASLPPQFQPTFSPPNPFALPIPERPGVLTQASGRQVVYPSFVPQTGYAAPVPPHGLGGFLHNLLGDVTGIVSGLSQIGGQVVHDTLKTVTLGALYGNTPYEIPHTLSQMPEALKADYLSRYGSFSKFLTGLYQHPLGFLTDVGTLATAGGAGAVMAAKLAAQGTEAAATIGRIGDAARAAENLRAAQAASDVARTTGDVSKLGFHADQADLAAKTLDALGFARDTDPASLWNQVRPGISSTTGRPIPGPLQEGLPAITQSVLPGFGYKTMQGGYRYIREGADLVEQGLAQNPFKRFLQTDVYSKLTTVPVEKLAQTEGDVFRGETMGGERGAGITPGGITDIQKAITTAQALGLPRIERPIISNYRLSEVARRMVNLSRAQAYSRRNAEISEFVSNFRQAGISGDALGTYHQSQQGMDEAALAAHGVAPDHIAALTGRAPSTPESAAAANAGLKAALFSRASEFHGTTPIHAGYEPVGAAIGGSIAPSDPAIITGEDMARNTGTDGDAALISLTKALSDAGHVVGTGYVEDSLPVARVIVQDLRDAPSILGKLRALPGVRPTVDDLVANPRELMPTGYHLAVDRPDGTVARIEVYTPQGMRAADVARPTVDAATSLATAREAGWHALRSGGDLPEGQTAETLQAVLPRLADDYAKTVAHHAMLMESARLEARTHLLGYAPTATELAHAANRLSIEAHWVVPDLLKNSNTFTPAKAFERDMLPLRLASGADRFNPVTKEWEGGADPYDLYLAHQRTGLPSPTYFPHQPIDKGKWSDYLMPGRMGAVKKAGYMQRNEGILFREGRYATDPIEAFGRRASRAVMHQASFNAAAELAKRFGRDGGRPLTREELMTFDPRKESLLSLAGIRSQVGGKIAIDDAIAKHLSAGLSEDDAVRQGLKDVLPDVHAEIVKAATGGALSNVTAVPKIVADRFRTQFLPTFGPNARIFFDTPTKLWRQAVLFGSPRFLLRHFFGHLVFIKAQGGKFSDVVRQLDPSFRRMLSVAVPSEAMGLFTQGIEQYTPKLGAAVEANRAGATLGSIMQAGERATGAVATGVRKWVDFNRAANAGVENTLRQAGFLKAVDRQRALESIRPVLGSFWRSKVSLERLVQYGANPRVAGAAAKEVLHFYGNYNFMRPIERNLIRPYIAPFWSFYKHVTKLLVTLPYTNPVRFQLLRQAGQLGEDMAAQNVPTWLAGAVPTGAGDQPGETSFLSGAVLNPFEAVLRTPISLLHPLWSTALEYATGRKLSTTGEPFTAPDVVTPFGSTKMFRVDASGHATPVDAVRPGIGELLLRSFPFYQQAEAALAGGKTYDTANLLQILEGQGVRERPAYPGGPQVPLYPETPLDRLVLPQLGISTYSYNVGKYQSQLGQQETTAILEYLRQQGLAPQPAA